MSSTKRPAPYDSSDDEADLEFARGRQSSKREECDNDAALALELQKQEDPNYSIPDPTDRQSQGQEKKHDDGDDRDTDNALQESHSGATYAMCCFKCS